MQALQACATLNLNMPVSVRRLKDKGRTFREAFLAKLALLLRGTVAAPPERFGETLADEHIRGGAPTRDFSFGLPCLFMPCPHTEKHHEEPMVHFM